MAEKPRDVKLSDLMRPKGKRKEKPKRYANSYREAKAACG